MLYKPRTASVNDTRDRAVDDRRKLPKIEQSLKMQRVLTSANTHNSESYDWSRACWFEDQESGVSVAFVKEFFTDLEKTLHASGKAGQGYTEQHREDNDLEHVGPGEGDWAGGNEVDPEIGDAMRAFPRRRIGCDRGCIKRDLWPMALSGLKIEPTSRPRSSVKLETTSK